MPPGVRCLLVVALFGLLSIAGCSSSKSSDSDQQESDTARQCNEPENPYAEGTGHYAGYEWAESNGSGNCAGSSQSFAEGCEEYEAQESEYEECEARRKN